MVTSVPSGSDRKKRRGPWFTLLAGLLLLLVAGAASSGVLDRLKSGGFDDPGSDSVAAAEALERSFPDSQPNLVILIKDPRGGPGSAAARNEAETIGKTVSGTAGTRVVASYFDSGDKSLRSGDAALILVRVDGDENESMRTADTLHEKLSDPDGAVSVSFGGITAINNDMNKQVEKDIVAAESIAIPITLLLLVIVFRGLIAALLPMLLAVLTIVGALAAVNVAAQFTDVSVFAVNLITALGLGLSVDYSLLIVTRYREEREAGRDNATALRVTRATAGRTVAVSGAVVGAALATLLVFDQYFLRSFALAGIAVVLWAVLGSLYLLPASLVLLGDRIDALGRRRRTRRAPAADTFWGRMAGLAFRRPALLATPVIALLLLMAVPFADAQFGVPDERVLPKATESRTVTEAVRDDFGVGDDRALNVVSEDWKGSDADLARYSADLSETAEVTRVVSAAGVFRDGSRLSPLDPRTAASFQDGDAVRLQVQTDVVPYSEQGGDLARAVRAVDPPGGGKVLVGGQAAQLVDITHSIAGKLPLAMALISILSLLFLFLLTGSVLMPVKALLFNGLSLVGILGVAVWVFVDGHLSGLLGFTPSPLAVSMPVLVFCIAFGLSMDYEVFLVSRIKERYDRTGRLEDSVREGLGASGPVITAAAAILAVSFFAMLTSGVSLIKMYGMATGLAIVLDAVLVRGVLVPAFMRAVGPYNWWAPAPLKALHRRFGIKESAEVEPAPAATAHLTSASEPQTTGSRP
ncbi:RND superfamily putative drug exporter [Streptomyces sp. TLI_55]|uniref:MMPL family transporter n=1 Tax=Streptomyces sp. TLI_55 TaxID=1938861 RepID=UPI000BD5F532|nr:MMPL family transporter [Streptomyces sp. TLI_55]SNX66036.1 RND superfamily putative drug exporter [Streptomyces sp. TLI_55]